MGSIRPIIPGDSRQPEPTTKGKGKLQGREVTLLQDTTNLASCIRSDWDQLAPEELAEKIIELEDKVSLFKESTPAIEKVKKATEHLHFDFVLPAAIYLRPGPFSFVDTMEKIGQKVLKTNSAFPFEKELNETQKGEVMRHASRREGISAEGLSHAMQMYVSALQDQVATAEEFFFGRVGQGMQGLLQLPEDVRLRIDQLIWDAAGGKAIDPTEKESQSLIAAAIMHSVEERMGLFEL